VARGEADHGAVVAHALRQFSKKFAHFVKHVDAIDALFEAKFDPRAAGSADAAPFSKCGRCLRYLRLTKTRTPRLTCPFEDVSYALPPGALVSKFDGRQCPLCGFEVLACGYGGDIAFPLCPFCYARPPSGRLETDPRSPQPFSCPHPPSHPVVDAFAVRPCPSCEAERAGRASGEGVVVGWLITELLPRGKKGASVRKVHCTACETTLRLPPSVKECRPTRFSCGGCGHRCVEVKYDEETTPLAGGETRHVACVACEDLLHHQSVLVKVPRRRGEAKDGRRDRERRR
jgi:DNA topoisomerase-3